MKGTKNSREKQTDFKFQITYCFSNRKAIVSINKFDIRMKNFFYYNLEIGIWCSALIYFSVIDPTVPQLFSLCPLHNLGFDFCPGCGLGRSISYVLHGDIVASLKCHPLGIPAAIILGQRIYHLSKNIFRYQHYSSL